MSKKVIAIWYGISCALVILPILANVMVAVLIQLGVIIISSNFSFVMVIQPLSLLMIILSVIPDMIAWIGTLINLGRAHAWFIPTFFFGGIVVLIYLIAGPKPLSAEQSLPIPTYPQYNYQPEVSLPLPPQAYQSQQQLSSLEILQRRFVRGEIDAATFHQISEQLKASEHRNDAKSR